MGNSLGGTKRVIGRLWGEAKTSLYRNAIFLMANSVVGQGLGFFFWAVVTRVYAKSDIGFAVALFSTVGFVSSLALLGQNVAIIRYLPEAEDKADLVNVSLTLVGVASVLLSLGFLLVIALFGLELSFVLANPAYPILIVVGCLASTLGPILDNAAVALRRSDIPMWRTAALGVMKIPIAYVIALTLSVSLGVGDRKSTRLNSSHGYQSRMPSSA